MVSLASKPAKLICQLYEDYGAREPGTAHHPPGSQKMFQLRLKNSILLWTLAFPLLLQFWSPLIDWHRRTDSRMLSTIFNSENFRVVCGRPISLPRAFALSIHVKHCASTDHWIFRVYNKLKSNPNYDHENSQMKRQILWRYYRWLKKVIYGLGYTEEIHETENQKSPVRSLFHCSWRIYWKSLQHHSRLHQVGLQNEIVNELLYSHISLFASKRI